MPRRRASNPAGGSARTNAGRGMRSRGFTRFAWPRGGKRGVGSRAVCAAGGTTWNGARLPSLARGRAPRWHELARRYHRESPRQNGHAVTVTVLPFVTIHLREEVHPLGPIEIEREGRATQRRGVGHAQGVELLLPQWALSQSSSGHIRRDLELMSTLRGVEQGVCSGYLLSSPHIPTSVSVRPFFGLSGPSRASATQTTGCWTFLFLPAGLGPQSSRRVALPNRAFSSFTFPVRFVAWTFLYTDTQTAVQ